MKVWLNGRILDERRATVSVFDHAFLYGDGLYETVRLSSDGIFLWPAHFQRFKKSARSLAFPFPWSSAFLEKAIRALAAANRAREATARLTLSRGAGALGLDPALCPAPTLVIQLHPARDLERLRREGVSLGIVSTRRSSTGSAALKSTSVQSLVRARMEAKRLKVFEGLLLNTRGEVTEGTVSNLFFVHRGILKTPALSCGLLPGVTRAHVLRLARRVRIPVREGSYRPADLLKAEELFLTNTSFEILPISILKVGKHLKKFTQNKTGTVIQQLQAAYQKSF